MFDLFGTATIAALQAKLYEAETEIANLNNSLALANARPDFYAVATDLKLGESIMNELIEKFYENYGPMFAEHVIHTLRNVQWEPRRPPMHSVAAGDPYAKVAVQHHYISIPELHARIQVYAP